MKEISQIIHDERAYIESIGKHDKATVCEALFERGADTTLRICIGVSGIEMPRRALGYYASALAVQERYFPEAELQIVYPLLAATKVNGVAIDQAQRYAEDLDRAAQSSFPAHFQQDRLDTGEIKSFFDGQLPDDELHAAVAEVLALEPELSSRFQTQADRRRSDYVSYVAAHVLMHDTNPRLSPMANSGPARMDGRVISIGAQSERPFYLARMALRRANVLPKSIQVATGQLFTRHVIPPYLNCREGEPGLGESGAAAYHPVASVQRDLQFLNRALLCPQQGAAL